MTSLSIFKKIKNRLWNEIIKYSRNTIFYNYLYRSWWHYYFYKTGNNTNDIYFSAIPNPGAGIGHQMANWIAGYWFAKQFGLKFAHISFSTQNWDKFLGFGEGEPIVDELVKCGYKIRRLPLFDENNESKVNQVKAIIQSYAGKKIIFIAEQDQFYADQFGVMNEIKLKFHNAQERKNMQLIYSEDHFNIALHIRRGDIVVGQQSQNPNLIMRWQNNNYFVNVLTNVLANLKTEKKISLYLFSQGKIEDFSEFAKFENIHYCFDLSAQDSFLHMVYADLIITSKSSFSYKPALLSKGIKVCPKDFWHGYPKTKDWILANNDGKFEVNYTSTIV